MTTRIVAVLILTCIVATLPATAAPWVAQPPKVPVGPQYNAKGDLLLPTDYRTWVFVGSNLGLKYKKPQADAAPKENARQKGGGMGDFHNVYINPEAYQQYVKTGVFPDKSMLVMDVYEAKERDAKDIVSKGLFPGDQLAVEVAVKNNKRPDGSKTDWAYYAFPLKSTSAKAFPDSACYNCHRQHAQDDNVWVQFYPTLRMVKK